MTLISRDTIPDKIIEYISQKIIQGKWKVDEKIPSEITLAEELGVSRMTVHTAVQRLTGLGLLKTSNGSGTYVRQFRMEQYFKELFDLSLIPSSYVELNQFKTSLEIGCLQMCLLTEQDDDSLNNLDNLLTQMKKEITDEDFEKFVETDFQFHKHISIMSNNNMMVLLYDGISSVFHKIYKMNTLKSIEKTGSSKRLIEHHQNIINAIRTHDWLLCNEIARSSLKHATEYFS